MSSSSKRLTRWTRLSPTRWRMGPYTCRRQSSGVNTDMHMYLTVIRKNGEKVFANTDFDVAIRWAEKDADQEAERCAKQSVQ